MTPPAKFAAVTAAAKVRATAYWLKHEHRPGKGLSGLISKAWPSLTPPGVISRHALRNALLPAITAPGGKSQRRCPDRYREPFSPISRLLDGGLRHTYAGREQSRGKGIGRGANSAVARPRRSWPTLGGAVWESGERREAEVP
jgi:hypothetical protein